MKGGGTEPKTRGSRRWRRRWGGVCPSPLKNGSGKVAVPPPQNFYLFFWFNVFKKFLRSGQVGGGHRSVPPGLKYATAAAVSGQFWRVSATLALAACMICHIIPLVTGCITY